MSVSKLVKAVWTGRATEARATQAGALASLNGLLRTTGRAEAHREEIRAWLESRAGTLPDNLDRDDVSALALAEGDE